MVMPISKDRRSAARDLVRTGCPRRETPLGLCRSRYTGDDSARQTLGHGIEFHVVKKSEAKQGFVLLPRRWVVEHCFSWAARFRRLARDDERLNDGVIGLHWLAFSTRMLQSLGRQSQ